MNFEELEERVNNRGGVSYWKDGVMIYKKCTKCGELKTIEEFNYQNKKHILKTNLNIILKYKECQGN